MQYRAEFPVHFPSPVLKKSGQLKESVQEILPYTAVQGCQEMCMQVVYPGTGNLDIRPVVRSICGVHDLYQHQEYITRAMLKHSKASERMFCGVANH